jgi:type III secretion system low calcium response chaperone LcrH/SycD
MEDEFQIPEEAIERLKDPEVIKTYIAEGKTFQEIIGYSEETMEKFYQGACKLFENHRYDDASDAFVFLTTLNPYVHNFWLALGMAEQAREEYSAALVAYGMAGVNEPGNPLSLWHSAHCYYLIGDRKASLEMLGRLLKQCQAGEEHADIVSKARALIQRISNA